MDKIVSSNEIDEQLNLAQSCFKKHIAHYATAGDKVDHVLESNRKKVDEYEKTLDSCIQQKANPASIFEPLQKRALEYLELHYFKVYLVPSLKSEATRRFGWRAKFCQLI